ncbi:MAG: lysophospholipid acyltransferase family protein [Peptoniphilus sp.]|nr:lysophospholipid acyltransferase family protein [Peptoniphilus sp.]MDY3119257.1 lysophospholipid acyltransferase family protein [Peptoniphilus sp.]
MFYSFVKGITGWLLKILYPYEVLNMPPLEDKAYLLVANHKSNWDPLFLSILFPKQIRWMAKRELFEIPLLKQILHGVGAISVDRDHGDAKSTIIAMRTLKKKEIIGIFPEGTRVKTADYDKAKVGTILLATRTGTDVLPVYIEGEYKLFHKRRYIFREPIPFEKEKLSEETLHTRMHALMKTIYEGRSYLGNSVE